MAGALARGSQLVRHERDIPTTEERKKLEALAALGRALPDHRQEELMAHLQDRDSARIDPVLDAAAFTLRELAATYKLSVRTLLRHIESGELEALKIGRSYRVTRAQLAAWLERCKSA